MNPTSPPGPTTLTQHDHPDPTWPAPLRTAAVYALVIFANLLAWQLTLLVWPWVKPNVGPAFFVTMIAVAWYGGILPALASTAIAGFFMTYVISNPADPRGFGAGDFARIVTFVTTALMIAWLNQARKSAQVALAESWRLQGNLEDQRRRLESTNERLRREVTHRQLAQEETLAHQETLRKLAAELSLTEERERREIAAQLHDGVAQLLAFAQMRLETARAALPDAATPRAAVEEAIAQLKEAIAQTRLLTRELSPPVLYESGLENAMEWLADNVRRRHNLEVSIDRHGRAAGPDAIPRELRVFLFQAVRELLTNVVKHARATQVHVTLYVQHDSIRVVVEDDGLGRMPDVESLRDGFGLLNIRERARYLGGHLEIENDPGRGARVTVTVPITPPTTIGDARDAA